MNVKIINAKGKVKAEDLKKNLKKHENNIFLKKNSINNRTCKILILFFINKFLK